MTLADFSGSEVSWEPGDGKNAAPSLRVHQGGVMGRGPRGSLVLGTVLAAVVPGVVVSGGAAYADDHPARLRLVSHGAQRQLADAVSWGAALSGNGEVVGFASRATNLPAAGGWNQSQVFLWGRRDGGFVRASSTRLGAPTRGSADQPALSRTGRYAVFSSDAQDLAATGRKRVTHIYRFDEASGRVILVDRSARGRVGNDFASSPDVSGSGRFVAFQSYATNLIKKHPLLHAEPEIYVRDTRTKRTVWVSRAANGSQGRWGAGAPSISADGRVVAFWSRSPLVRPDTPASGDVFVKDLGTGRLTRVPVTGTAAAGDYLVGRPHISPNGRYVAFAATRAGAASAPSLLYVYDRSTRQTRRVDVRPFGRAMKATSTVAALSYDARYLAFDSRPFLGNIPMRNSAFLLDRVTGKVRRLAGIGPAVTEVSAGDLSWDGRVATVELDKVIDPASGRTRSEVYLADLG
jgi:Tol biopolymer transport system component